MRWNTLRARPANESLLCEMMRGFPLFSSLIRNVELAMAKADLTIARLYADWSSTTNCASAFGRCWRRNSNVRRMVLAVTEQGELLKKNPVLSRSIRLRNPYVDPMSLIQVDLLRRKRAGGNKTA